MKKILYLLLVSAPIFSMQQQPVNNNQPMNDKKLPLIVKKQIPNVDYSFTPFEMGMVGVSEILPAPGLGGVLTTSTIIMTQVFINYVIDAHNNNRNNNKK